jgi:hypothetical protein
MGAFPLIEPTVNAAIALHSVPVKTVRIGPFNLYLDDEPTR